MGSFVKVAKVADVPEGEVIAVSELATCALVQTHADVRRLQRSNAYLTPPLTNRRVILVNNVKIPIYDRLLNHR